MAVESFFIVQNNPPPDLLEPQPKVRLRARAAPEPKKQADAPANTPEEKIVQFLDLIMAQLDEKPQELPENTQHKLLASDNPVLTDKPGLNLAQLVAANPEIKEEVENFIESTQLGDDIALSQTLALNKIALDKILKPLTGEIQADQTLGDETLTVDTNEIPEELSALLNLNLTPAQITALQKTQDSQDANKEEKTDATDAIFTQFVIIAPPQKGNPESKEQTLPPQDNAAALLQQPSAPLARLKPLNNPQTGNNEQEEQILKYLEANFKNILKNTSNDSQQPIANTGKINPAQQAATAPGAATTGNGTLQGWPFSTDGSLFAPFNASESVTDDRSGLLSPNATQMGSLTSLLAQVQNAAQPHPASQALALTVQKAAGKGGDTNLTLQLDPPELGRVEVRLNFAKDKALKAHIIAEKPETLLMLQRDSQLLERAIQDIGLDGDGGISFELAEQGFDFEQNNGRGGGHDPGGTGAGDNADAPDIIESTMTWHIDPETGHMRYNILA